jgi:uncharacterized protein YigE (DUF2233 family)
LKSFYVKSDLDEKIKRDKYQRVFAFNAKMYIDSDAPGKYLEYADFINCLENFSGEIFPETEVGTRLVPKISLVIS